MLPRWGTRSHCRCSTVVLSHDIPRDTYPTSKPTISATSKVCVDNMLQRVVNVTSEQLAKRSQTRLTSDCSRQLLLSVENRPLSPLSPREAGPPSCPEARALCPVDHPGPGGPLPLRFLIAPRRERRRCGRRAA
eukprot:7888534-Pyramimonas_sp.AAC.3